MLGLLTALPAWSTGSSATVTTSPSPAYANRPLEVTISTSDLGSEVYCYTWCADINGSTKSPWQWDDVHTDKFRMSGSNGVYTITIDDIKEFYGLTDSELAGLNSLGFIAKTISGSQTEDCFVTVEQEAPVLYSGGEGSQSNPYSLTTVADLNTLAATPSDWSVTTYFSLDADIDASSMVGMIGSMEAPFKAHFAGNGHAISDFKAANSGIGSATGFFAAIDGAEISDFGLVNANVNGATYTGALVGHAASGSIERCFTSGSVTGSSVCVGGLIGDNVAATVTDCYSMASVDNRNDYATGGLIGKNSGSVTNTYASGDVTGFDYAGGLIGANYGSVSNSVSLNGSVTSASDFSARFGGNNNPRNNSTGNHSWDNMTPGHGSWTEYGDHATTHNASYLLDYDSFKSMSGWDFDNVWSWQTVSGKSYPVLSNIAMQTNPLPSNLYDAVTGISNIINDSAATFVTAGPNPTFGELTVNATNPLSAVALYNLNGACMAAAEGNGATEITLDLTSLPAGMYILNVTDSQTSRSTFKIIKK